MLTGEDIPKEVYKDRGPRTLARASVFWLPLIYFLYGP